MSRTLLLPLSFLWLQLAACSGTEGDGGGNPGSGGAPGSGAGGGEPGVGGSTAGNGGSSSSGGGSTGTGGAPPAPDPGCGTRKWACWPMPNPAGSGLPNPAQYVDSGDGTVTDEMTGLIWQKVQPDETFDWDEALAYCDGLSLGGQSDWRLPTRIEFTSIVDWTVNGAKVDSGAFPGPRGGFHRTSSDWYVTIVGSDSRAWAFNLADGIVSNAYGKADAASLRCVRGGSLEGEAPSELAVEPPDHYTVLSDDEARDNYTGLVWQRLDSDEELSWEEAVAYCDSLDIGDQQWRLPSIRELATLVDEADVAPSIHEEVFPDTKWGSRTNNWYWASHRAHNQETAAWALNFDDGFTGFNVGAPGAWNHFTAGYAKCVR